MMCNLAKVTSILSSTPDESMPNPLFFDCKSLVCTMTNTHRRATRVARCGICNAAIEERGRITPEAATHFVQLCGLACHETWRQSQPVDARLAARGGDLSVGE